MTLTKAWDSSALLSGLKSASLADAPKAVGILLGTLLAWIAASLAFLVSSNPILGLLSGLVPTLVGSIQAALLPSLPGLSILLPSLSLSKAWDTQALLSALKSSEVPELEQIVVDDSAVLFAWIQASLSLGSALEQGLAPLIGSIAGLVASELAVLEAKI
jgi:hypothetical protein